MLLAIDVGNTQTVIGLFDDSEKLFYQWRITTRANETPDEKSILLSNLLLRDGLNAADISSVVLSSVVPDCTSAMVEMSRGLLKLNALVVDSATTKQLKIAYKHPREIGADRIVNAIAAIKLFGGPLIIVDFGTATTFDVISNDGTYMGGAIAPGIKISSDALFDAAAKLNRVVLTAPKKTVGTDTSSSLQSGIIFGGAALVDGMIERIKTETKTDYKTIATGGLAELITPYCAKISHIEPFLTLYGLQLVFKERYGL